MKVQKKGYPYSFTLIRSCVSIFFTVKYNNKLTNEKSVSKRSLIFKIRLKTFVSFI